MYVYTVYSGISQFIDSKVRLHANIRGFAGNKNEFKGIN